MSAASPTKSSGRALSRRDAALPAVLEFQSPSSVIAATPIPASAKDVLEQIRKALAA